MANDKMREMAYALAMIRKILIIGLVFLAAAVAVTGFNILFASFGLTPEDNPMAYLCFIAIVMLMLLALRTFLLRR